MSQGTERRDIHEFTIFRLSDQASNVKERYHRHTSQIADYQSLISDFGGFTVDSNQLIETLFEVVESKLDKPLPTVYH